MVLTVLLQGVGCVLAICSTYVLYLVCMEEVARRSQPKPDLRDVHGSAIYALQSVRMVNMLISFVGLLTILMVLVLSFQANASTCGSYVSVAGTAYALFYVSNWILLCIRERIFDLWSPPSSFEQVRWILVAMLTPLVLGLSAVGVAAEHQFYTESHVCVMEMTLWGCTVGVDMCFKLAYFYCCIYYSLQRVPRGAYRIRRDMQHQAIVLGTSIATSLVAGAWIVMAGLVQQEATSTALIGIIPVDIMVSLMVLRLSRARGSNAGLFGNEGDDDKDVGDGEFVLVAPLGSTNATSPASRESSCIVNVEPRTENRGKNIFSQRESEGLRKTSGTEKVKVSPAHHRAQTNAGSGGHSNNAAASHAGVGGGNSDWIGGGAVIGSLGGGDSGPGVDSGNSGITGGSVGVGFMRMPSIRNASTASQLPTHHEVVNEASAGSTPPSDREIGRGNTVDSAGLSESGSGLSPGSESANAGSAAVAAVDSGTGVSSRVVLDPILKPLRAHHVHTQSSSVQPKRFFFGIVRSPRSMSPINNPVVGHHHHGMTMSTRPHISVSPAWRAGGGAQQRGEEKQLAQHTSFDRCPDE